MNTYSKVLALYTSFPTERRAHFSIKGCQLYLSCNITNTNLLS